jgi:rhodanese-related sulfurtransferase
LDAREDIEVEVGYMPWSIHIRFADLKAWDYKKLDKEKNIYVYCRSWIRWKQVTEYLKTKWFKSRYLLKWASSWYSYWGYWNWKIKVSNVYDAPQYKKIFMKKDLESMIKNWVVLIDSRWLDEYKKEHLSNVLNVPLVDLFKDSWNDYINKIPKKSEIINICDSYVNCFYAKVVWIELERRWYKFLWVYSLIYN